MKTLFKYIILIHLILFEFTQVDANNEIRVPSNIKNVTVFLNQAQITRVAKTNLSAGITHIVFDKISPHINLSSIQVKTSPNINLLSVTHRYNYLKNEEKPKSIIELEDSIGRLNDLLDYNKIRKESFALEKELLISNKNLGGANTGVKVDELEDALTLYRKRSSEIGDELIKLKKQEIRLNDIRKKLQSQLDEYKNNSDNNLEIVITVKTLTALSNAQFEWDYLVGNVSWKPFYDIRVKDTKNALQLVSKAYITQGTGEDWNNVILKLSTTNPNESGVKPELLPIYLSYNQPYISQDMVVYKKKNLESAPASENQVETQQPEYTSGNAEALQTDINMEYNVTSTYNIKSDHTPHQVDLTTTSMNAKYIYMAVPKMDKHAYVVAGISADDFGVQIGGEANVYFDGSFVGKTIIQPNSADSVFISLGRDKRIQIQRTLLKDFSSKSLTGSMRKDLNTWEISVRNTLKENIQILIEDQIPVSTNKEIEVKILNNGNAQLDETTGKIRWQMLLENEKSLTLRFSYEVKYPKDKLITPY
jgi:uncharacterized protein (TIGR02231 family)